MDEEMLRLLGLGPPIKSDPKPKADVGPKKQYFIAASSDKNVQQIFSKAKPSVIAASASASAPPKLPKPRSPGTSKRNSLPLKPQQIDLLCDSLVSADFSRYGNIFVHSKSAVTLELTGSQISVDARDLSEDDVYEFLRHEFEANVSLTNVGKHLLEAINDMRVMASDEADPEDSSEASLDPSDAGFYDKRCMERLPTSPELSEHIWPDGSRQINRHRQLLIFSYGDRKMKKTALRARGSQFNINAKPLSGHGGGANLRNNALQDRRIMLNVATSLSRGHGHRLLANAVRKIEEEDLNCISVHCSAGRHRSVSLSMLLKLIYYPEAKVTHLTIK